LGYAAKLAKDMSRRDGVTSGLGYAIKDARETLSYDHLTAMVLTIGILGYVLDTVCALLIKRFSWHRGDA